MTREELREIENRRDSLRVEERKLNDILGVYQGYFRQLDDMSRLVKRLPDVSRLEIFVGSVNYSIPVKSDECRAEFIHTIELVMKDLEAEMNEVTV